MPLPGNYSTRSITGTVLNLHDGTPAVGIVQFTPSLVNQFLFDGGANTTIAPTPTIAVLDGTGSFTVALGTTDDPDVSPNGWVYNVEIATNDLAGNGQHTAYAIQVPAGSGSLDIADIPPVVDEPETIMFVKTVNSIPPDATGNVDVANTLAILNRNSGFEVNANGWTASGGAVARSTAQSFAGTASLLLTPTGGVAAEARTDLTVDGSPTVVVGETYFAAGWVRSPTGFATVDISIDWLNAADATISTISCSTVDLAVDRWTYLSVRGVAPALSVKARIRFRETGTPAAGDLLYVDEAIMIVNAGTTALNDLSNLNVPTPTGKDVLQYNSGTGKWTNIALPLDDLGNVNAPAPVNGDALLWDSGTSQWIPSNKSNAIVARKASTEAVNNSTVLQNDDELLWAVAASVIYWFEATIQYFSTSVADIKIQWTLPAGAIMRWSAIGVDTALAFKCPSALTESSVQSFGGDSTARVIEIRGTVIVSTTAGNLRLQWAQNTAEATNTQVIDNSFGTLHRIT